MVTNETTAAAKPSRYRTYEPQPFNEQTPGLEKRSTVYWWHDIYVGTAEAIVASGLATSDMLPGSPGVDQSSVRYRPAGTSVSGSHPGNLEIFRRPRGMFRVALRVSEEEYERRSAADEKRREQNVRDLQEARQAKWQPQAAAGHLQDDELRAMVRQELQAEFRRRTVARRALPAGWRVIVGGAA